MNFVYEILAVGLSTAIIGFIISTMLMYVFVKDFSKKSYHFWWQVMLSYFITGCLVHILCQVTGVNKWYCKNGVACK
jgi:multisubunit Na+/H+ antiporter MnhE subunit